MVLLLLSCDGLAAASLRDSAEVEPALKGAHAGEDLWQQEVEQAPQLAQVVLQRGACARQACILAYAQAALQGEAVVGGPAAHRTG